MKKVDNNVLAGGCDDDNLSDLVSQLSDYKSNYYYASLQTRRL